MSRTSAPRMRSLRLLAVLAALLAGPAAAQPLHTTWWMSVADGTPPDGTSEWNDPLNWKTTNSMDIHLTYGVPVYVSAEHPLLAPNVVPDIDAGMLGDWQHDGTCWRFLPTSVAETACQPPVGLDPDPRCPATTGSFYVGGWTPEFDGEPHNHGAPEGESELTISGHLVTTQENDCAIPGRTGVYVSVGVRSKGTVTQYDPSYVYSRRGLRLGAGSSDAVGIWKLEGGELDTIGVSIGYQGRALLQTSGGVIHICTKDDQQATEVCGPAHSTKAGRGFTSPEAGYVPGLGVLDAGGGSLFVKTLSAGAEIGSMGAAEISDGSLDVGKCLIGEEGFGAVVQTGGTVECAGALRLGAEPGGHGQYTFRGGTLGPGRIELGLDGPDCAADTLGHGHLRLEGPSVSVATALSVGAGSTLSFVLGQPDDRHIDVPSNATFCAGSQLQLFADGASPPSDGQPFTIVKVGAALTDAGLTIVGEEAAQWSMSTATGDLVVTYHANP